jgi:hypothetical protein
MGTYPEVYDPAMSVRMAVLATVVILLGVGCQTSCQEPACGGGSAGGPLPDPITQPLTADAARREAARLARAAWAGADVRDGAGRPVPMPPFEPGGFQGEMRGGRWELRCGGPAGSYAEVSFGQWADHPQVRVGWAAD